MTKPRTTRIFTGTPEYPEYLRVKVIDAKEKLTINGTMADALMGRPGLTVGCQLSFCAQNNADAFPHPVIVVAVTKSTLLAVAELFNEARRNKEFKKHGFRIDGLAYKYRHSLGKWVKMNDTDKAKATVKAHPELAERPFTLYPPTGPRLDQRKDRNRGNRTGTKVPTIPAGALRRAVAAGLVNEGVAGVLEHIAKKKSQPPAFKQTKAAETKERKIDIIRRLLLRREGVTAKQARETVGWKAIAMTQQAKDLGLILIQKKEGSETRYWGKPTTSLAA